MTHAHATAEREAQQREFYRKTLDAVRQVIGREYGLRRVSIRPIGAKGSRLSLPVRITGIDAQGRPVRYFGKILGGIDALSARSVQFFKNLYLHLTDKDPIFGFTDTPEELARQQFESLSAMHVCGIPTAKPLGYHHIDGIIWLLVAEFLDSRPVASCSEVSTEQIDLLFGYLRRLHENKVYHGDLKPDNIMVGKAVCILDCGIFREDVATARKQAYDLACLICSFIECHSMEETIRTARNYYSRRDILDAVDYLHLVQKRPDFHFTIQECDALERIMLRVSAETDAPVQG